MRFNTPIVLLFFCLFYIPLYAQNSKSDSVQAKKEIQRVNNTKEVQKIVIPNLEPEPIVLTSVTTAMSKGENPGIQLDIPEVTVDDVQRDLERRIKNKTKSKFVKSGNETAIQETIIKEISDTPLNFFVKVMPLDSGSRIISFAEDQGAFITESADADKYARFKSFVRDFGVEAYREKVADQIKLQEKALSDLEGDLNKLKKQNEKMHTDIRDNEAAIVNSEVDIKANVKQQELKDDDIIKQKSVVSSTTDKETRKLENKKLNDLEKEKDKFRNEINSFNKKIVKSRANIENLEDEIELNLQEQELVKEKITAQRSLVKGLEGKLEKIK